MFHLRTFLLLALLAGVTVTPSWGQAEDQTHRTVVLDPADMDTGLLPSQDFYGFVNGKWARNHPIPASEASWGPASLLMERVLEDLHSLMDHPETGKPDRIADFYRTALDESLADRLGVSPLRPELEEVEKVSTPAGLLRFAAQCHTRGVGVVFIVGTDLDESSSGLVIPLLEQGGLGLPSPGYYTGGDRQSAAIRREYAHHIATMLGLLGESRKAAALSAAAVLRVEGRLARISLRPQESRDPRSSWNRMRIEDLQRLAPGVDWRDYFRCIGVEKPGWINVSSPGFFRGLSGLVSRISISDWRAYLRWQLLSQAAPFLSRRFAEEDFRFNAQFLSGTKAPLPRWKLAVEATSEALGDEVGRLWVERFFQPSLREKVRGMGESLKRALRRRLERVDWMGAATRREALAKLDAMCLKVGYPDHWPEDGVPEVRTDSWYLNEIRACTFAFHREMARIGKPADRTRWDVTPQTINAFYDSRQNEMVIPAALLQPPFFFPEGDDAVNFGSLGTVIGHEMTHGFDDEGCWFDARGDLRNWWNSADRKSFAKRCLVLVKDYGSREVLHGARIDGQMTLGENLADLGGVLVAFDAWRQSQKGIETHASIGGFSGDQRFFLSYCRLWAGSMREPELLRMLVEDVHSPDEIRAVVPLLHVPAFYEAFRIRPGDRMYLSPGRRARIW